MLVLFINKSLLAKHHNIQHNYSHLDFYNMF